MRYSIIEFGQKAFDVAPVLGIVGMSDGKDMKLSQGDITNYTLKWTDSDGVRMYTTRYTFLGGTSTTINMLFIPETHPYYNGGMFVSHSIINLGRYIGGGYLVAEVLHRMFLDIIDEIQDDESRNTV